jgi:hypothetical protein
MFLSQTRKSLQAVKLHTITGISRERQFVGRFEIGRSNYDFTFAPSKAEAAGGKLHLYGRLTVARSKGRPRSRDVRATLAGIQSGLGGPPPRPNQGETIAAFEKRRAQPAQQPADSKPLPVIESTGALSFTGVMYFHFEPISGRALGVAADMSRVQFNARLTTIDDIARTLHGIYCSLVDAVIGEKPDAEAAAALVEELNKKLRAS